MMTKLSDSQRVILSAAAQHERGLARAPKTLPAAARNAVFRSLIKTNLLTEINAPRDHVGLGWPARISGLIAAEISVDPHLLQTILQSHINDLLTEASDRFDPAGLGGDRTPQP
jgi:hypothetical protein